MSKLRRLTYALFFSVFLYVTLYAILTGLEYAYYRIENSEIPILLLAIALSIIGIKESIKIGKGRSKMILYIDEKIGHFFQRLKN